LQPPAPNLGWHDHCFCDTSLEHHLPPLMIAKTPPQHLEKVDMYNPQTAETCNADFTTSIRCDNHHR
jgi:hypothetical protein